MVVLLTVAPTGTTSLLVGNVSSGLEPVFAHKVKLYGQDWRFLKNDREARYMYGYGYLLYCSRRSLDPNSDVKLPDYFVEHDDVAVYQHVNMQAAIQSWVDASVSKTINCPKDISFEDFKKVYEHAYASNCKGCTTYRPSDVRGFVLQKADDEDKDEDTNAEQGAAQRPGGVPPRGEILNGRTYKVKWSEDVSYYVTINNDEEGIPREMFVNATSSQFTDWTTALCLLISALMRQGVDTAFVADELKKIVGVGGGVWIGGKYLGSLAGVIGETLKRHLTGCGIGRPDSRAGNGNGNGNGDDDITPNIEGPLEVCPSCQMPTLHHKEGCATCLSCDYSQC